MPHAEAGRAVIRGAAAAIALACVASAAGAELYKWVDEKGVTQYSEQPPPDGKAKKVELLPTGPVKAAPDWRQQEMELRKRRAEKELAEEDARSPESARRRQNCQTARRQLDILKAPRPVYNLNDRGEKVWLEDKDRAAEIERWTEEASRYCDR